MGSCVFSMCVIVGGVALIYPHEKEFSDSEDSPW